MDSARRGRGASTLASSICKGSISWVVYKGSIEWMGIGICMGIGGMPYGPIAGGIPPMGGMPGQPYAAQGPIVGGACGYPPE